MPNTFYYVDTCNLCLVPTQIIKHKTTITSSFFECCRINVIIGFSTVFSVHSPSNGSTYWESVHLYDETCGSLLPDLSRLVLIYLASLFNCCHSSQKMNLFLELFINTQCSILHGLLIAATHSCIYSMNSIYVNQNYLLEMWLYYYVFIVYIYIRSHLVFIIRMSSQLV